MKYLKITVIQITYLPTTKRLWIRTQKSFVEGKSISFFTLLLFFSCWCYYHWPSKLSESFPIFCLYQRDACEYVIDFFWFLDCIWMTEWTWLPPTLFWFDTCVVMEMVLWWENWVDIAAVQESKSFVWKTKNCWFYENKMHEMNMWPMWENQGNYDYDTTTFKSTTQPWRGIFDALRCIAFSLSYKFNFPWVFN